MAFKFVEKTPEVTRGRGSNSAPVFTEEQKAELVDNAAMWAVVEEDTKSPQKYVNWVKKTNGKDEDGKQNEGPWRVRTAVHRDKKTGEPHVEKGKTSKGKDKETRYVDVYVSYDPENKAK